jgi:RsiW-degrading membrane proteinase PrsW (M82 family)
MWLFKQSSPATRSALIYITAGAFVVIWTVVWYVYLNNNPPETNTVFYWATGFLMTGLTMILIGFGLGRISRAAQGADLPSHAVPLVVMDPQQNGAAPALVAPPEATRGAG